MQLNSAMGLAVCCYYRHTFGNYMNTLVWFRNYYSIRTFSSIPHLFSSHSVNWVLCTTLARKPQTFFHRYKSATLIGTLVNQVYLVSRGENHLWLLSYLRYFTTTVHHSVYWVVFISSRRRGPLDYSFIYLELQLLASVVTITSSLKSWEWKATQSRSDNHVCTSYQP